MQNSFAQYLNEIIPVNQGSRFLLAVSGGIDSVVMLDLFAQMENIEFGIAHCNFGLRGAESDEDENLVQELGERYHCKTYVKLFDTMTFAENHRISVQMAARTLRYAWFSSLAESENWDYIPVAHNKNDRIETFFINLLRGTGIKGLTSIPHRNQKIIRPLLKYDRKQIEEYAINRRLVWREDSSNRSVKYTRNKIRHEIIPIFTDLNPGFLSTMEENIGRIEQMEWIFDQILAEKKEALLTKKENHTLISLDELRNNPLSSLWLFEILSDYGFSGKMIGDIDKSRFSESGKRFFSREYELTKDRDFFILRKIEKNEDTPRKYYIDSEVKNLSTPINLEIDVLSRSDFVLTSNQNIACLDLDKVSFPLILRKWKHGDYFRPLGMKEMKKLSDFFIDNKVSLPEKQDTWILASGDDIIWIVGQRIDDRFKVSSETTKVLMITCHNED